MRQNPPTSLLDQPRYMRFLRLCPKLLGANLSVAEADGVYQRVKGTSGNRLNMAQFNEEVLPQVRCRCCACVVHLDALYSTLL